MSPVSSSGSVSPRSSPVSPLRQWSQPVVLVTWPSLLCGSGGRAVVGPTGCAKGQEMVRVNGLGVVE